AIHCGPEIEDDCQTGETENISGSEVLFVRDLLTVNKALVLKFPLPTEIGSEAGAIMLCCGHIVRTILPPVSDLPAPMAAQFKNYLITLLGISLLGVGLLVKGSNLTAPPTGTWLPAGTMASPRTGATAVLLTNGRVLMTGGTGTTSPLSTAEFLNSDGSFTAA